MKRCRTVFPNSGGLFDLDEKKRELLKLDDIASRPDFWNNKEEADTVIGKRNNLAKQVEVWGEVKQKLEDIEELLEMAEEENDPALDDEISKDIQGLLKQFHRMEGQAKLSGATDRNNAIFTITPGAGGTESQDWASMLLRMYLRWAEKNNFTTEILDYQDGEEAGIKSATILVKGNYAFGYLKAERGIHRLVRISPFDANKRRHTSFASFHVLPELDNTIEVELNEEDLRLDTYRASGAGGQHVNKTDSAIRLTHIPTGIVVQCQSERSQHKNKATALKVMKAKLYELEEEKKAKERESAGGEKKEIGWGSQIRSYVLHPYKMVKDLRTRYESGNVDAVLDGDIQGFIDEYLTSTLEQ